MGKGKGTGYKAGSTTNGPDWTDVAGIIREMEKVHSATVKVEVFTDGTNYVGTLYIRAYAVLPVLDSPGKTVRAEKFSRWPSHQHATMEGLIFKLLHLLDYSLSEKVYKQATLDLTAG